MIFSTRTVLFGLATTLAACGDNSMTAPKAGAPTTLPGPVAGGGSSAALTTTDTIRFSITIDPSRQTVYNLGAGNSIVFPAHSLCDVSSSSYGEGQWDKPCSVATAPATVPVKAWLDQYGKPRVDFGIHVRFVPTNNPLGWVKLTFADLEASLDPWFNILYCPTATSACYDESKTDPTLITVRDPVTGQVSRRLKHFSGYVVSADDGRDPGDGSGLSAGTTMQNAGWLAAGTTNLGQTPVVAVAVWPRRGQGESDALLYARAAVRRHSGYMLASG